MDSIKNDFIETCVQFEKNSPAALKQLFHVGEYSYYVSTPALKVKEAHPHLANKITVAFSHNKQHLYMCVIDKEKKTLEVYNGTSSEKVSVEFEKMYEDIKSNGVLENMMANAKQLIPPQHMKKETVAELNQLKNVVLHLEHTQGKKYQKNGTIFNFYQQFSSERAVENVVVHTMDTNTNQIPGERAVIVARSNKLNQELRIIMNMDKEGKIQNYEAGFYDDKNQKIDFCKIDSAVKIVKSIWNYVEIKPKSQIISSLEAIRNKSIETIKEVEVNKLKPF